MSNTKLKLSELITLAELIDFNEPTIDFEQWDETQVYMKAISDMLKNPVQKKAILIIAKYCTPMAVLCKKYLTNYIQQNSTVRL
tara:strand:- start:422 stop:673 length:252 start_codon:yes stop_codon:yes gene_type:complete